jgi:hypothetical protein
VTDGAVASTETQPCEAEPDAPSEDDAGSPLIGVGCLDRFGVALGSAFLGIPIYSMLLNRREPVVKEGVLGEGHDRNGRRVTRDGLLDHRPTLRETATVDSIRGMCVA